MEQNNNTINTQQKLLLKKAGFDKRNFGLPAEILIEAGL
jgi:hypothetical protein